MGGFRSFASYCQTSKSKNSGYRTREQIKEEQDRRRELQNRNTSIFDAYQPKK